MASQYYAVSKYTKYYIKRVLPKRNYNYFYSTKGSRIMTRMKMMTTVVLVVAVTRSFQKLSFLLEISAL